MGVAWEWSYKKICILRYTKLLHCLSSALKPSQPKDGRLVVECNRIRDMANVSSSTHYTPYLYYPMLYHVTLCYTKWLNDCFTFLLQKLLDTVYSDTPELRGTRADPEYLQSNLLGNSLVSFPGPFPSSLGLGMRLGQTPLPSHITG